MHLPVPSMAGSLKGKEKVLFTCYSPKKVSLGKRCIKLAEQRTEASPAMACTDI